MLCIITVEARLVAEIKTIVCHVIKPHLVVDQITIVAQTMQLF